MLSSAPSVGTVNNPLSSETAMWPSLMTALVNVKADEVPRAPRTWNWIRAISPDPASGSCGPYIEMTMIPGVLRFLISENPADAAMPETVTFCASTTAGS